jgi:threonine aldolase
LSDPRRDFRSDNVGGVAPELLEALIEAGRGTASPYGDDAYTARMVQRLSDVFEREVAAFPVTTGTGANAVALSAIANAYGSIYCHETAHIEVHECGAPEFYTGAKLVLLRGADYKIDADALEAALRNACIGDSTRVQPFAVSLTQPTDYGTVYAPAEIAAIASVARRHGLRVHMDGARFANAVAALGCRPAELTWRSGVDLLSLGATKNGGMNAEAVVAFDRSLTAQLPYRMKRGGLVLSKARFVSAQIERYVADDLWLERARRANNNARELAARLRAATAARLDVPVEINMVFVSLPEEAAAELERRGYLFYRIDAQVRLVCRHDHETSDLQELVAAVGASVDHARRNAAAASA